MAKWGKCIQCGYNKPLNSKGVCPDCVYKQNHSGKTKQEVYNERRVKKKVNPAKKNKSPNKALKREEKRLKRGVISQKDRETYKKVFEMKEPFCEECFTPLPEEFETWDGRIIMVSQYSHILSKGRYPEFRHNERNFNRLCFGCHQIWDFGDKEGMNIFVNNKKIIEELLKEKHGD